MPKEPEVWVHVTVDVIERAVNALKENSARKHHKARMDADADDAAAEALKKALRKDERP